MSKIEKTPAAHSEAESAGSAVRSILATLAKEEFLLIASVFFAPFVGTRLVLRDLYRKASISQRQSNGAGQPKKDERAHLMPAE